MFGAKKIKTVTKANGKAAYLKKGSRLPSRCFDLSEREAIKGSVKASKILAIIVTSPTMVMTPKIAAPWET